MLFFVSGSPWPLINKLERIGIYKTKVEEVGSEGGDFLDVHLYKGTDFSSTGQFDYRPVIRDNGRMLSPYSSHPIVSRVRC